MQANKSLNLWNLFWTYTDMKLKVWDFQSIHSSSTAEWSCWKLAGSGTRCRAGHARTRMFLASRDPRNTMGMRCWSWTNGATTGLRVSPRYLCAFKRPSSANCSPTWHCLPSGLYSETGMHPWSEELSTVPGTIECEPVTYDNELQLGWNPDKDAEHVNKLRWHGFWQFGTKFIGYANRLLQQLNSEDVGGEPKCGGPGLVWMNVQQRSLKWLMVETWTFSSGATALVDIPEVRMTAAHSLELVTSG